MPTFTTTLTTQQTPPLVGAGTTLGYVLQSNTGGTPVNLGYVSEVNPDPSMGTTEWTGLSSGVKRRIATVFDGGEVSATIAYAKGDVGYSDMRAAQRSGAYVEFVLTYPDGATDQFAAIVTKCSTKFSVEDVIMGDLNLAVDGNFVFTPSTATAPTPSVL